ncbi:MAG: multiple sugar transport system substrate-binding protein [Actinomycetota bacterium]
MAKKLKVALVGGPMYDRLYESLGDVEIVVHADHPTLNRRVAEMLAAGERIDVLSTHSKYAPSQRQWLQPLDLETSALAPAAVDLCTFRDELLSVPRCIDVRVLWSRVPPPASWDELVASDVVFGFPGRESGLFGTFFELVTSRRGRLFDDRARPTMDTPEAHWAVETLCALAARAPSDLPDWHYDGVDAALHEGRIDAAGVWPGGTADVRGAGNDLLPYPYPGGTSYAGCHSWAIPTTCGDIDGALAHIERMTSVASSMLDAENGTVPANVDAFANVVPEDDVDARRLAITRDTIATGMITYPPLERFPAVEDAGWQAINDALRGNLAPADVPPRIQAAAESALS